MTKSASKPHRAKKAEPILPTTLHGDRAASASATVPRTACNRPERSDRRSIVLSAIAIVGIIVLLAGAALTVISFFIPSEGSNTFTARTLGVKVDTTNVGLALCVVGLMFTGLVRFLLPAAPTLFYEVRKRPWMDRTPAWLAPALILFALGALAALIVRLV